VVKVVFIKDTFAMINSQIKNHEKIVQSNKLSLKIKIMLIIAEPGKLKTLKLKFKL